VPARGSGSPDFAKSDAPVAKSSGAWVREDHHTIRDRPRAFAGLGVLWACTRIGGGGSVLRRSSACGVPTAGACYGLPALAQKV
jgi:hypothetical protein